MSKETLRAAGESIAVAQVADRKRSIPYRPEYNAITGNVISSLWLQQLWYWWQTNGRKPFYKFRGPCQDRAYRHGDSWMEELGLTGSQFDSARSAIAKKITKGIAKNEARADCLVIYWTDSSRRTWYELNEDLFFKLLGLAYSRPEALEDLEIQKRLGNPGFLNYLEDSGILDYLVTTESRNALFTETTPQITTEKEFAAPAAEPVESQGIGAWFQSVVAVCSIDLDLATGRQKGMIKQAAEALRKNGVTPEQIAKFRHWWDSTWRGKQGQAPTVAQLREHWGEFKDTGALATFEERHVRKVQIIDPETGETIEVEAIV